MYRISNTLKFFKLIVIYIIVVRVGSWLAMNGPPFGKAKTKQAIKSRPWNGNMG